MALPPGASSQLESQRAEELRRRRHRQAQEQRNKETSSQPNLQPQPSSPPSNLPPPRRLAPGRKKSTISKIAKSLPPAAIPAVSTRLPIDVSLGKERHELSDVVECFEDEHANQGSAGNNSKNIADWTLRRDDIDSKQPVPISKVVEEDEDADGDDTEQEYHGEIQSTTSTDHRNVESDNEDEEEEEEGFKIITEEQISLNPPPPTEPLVLVNLGALCGCLPADQEEKAILANQLIESLLGPSMQKNGEDDGDENNSQEQQPKKDNLLGDGLSLDFDERVVELLESGVARHVDSSHPIVVSSFSEEVENEGEQRAEVNPYAVVPYPEFLASTGATTRSTLRLWKLLHTTPTVAQSSNNGDDPSTSDYSILLSRVFTHLRNTSRSLLWKADMHRELSLLVRQEHLAKLKRVRQREYNLWKEGVRKDRLEKLYDIRETFTLQVGVAKKKYDKFVEEREGRVDRELLRRGLHELRSTELSKSENPAGGSSRQNDDDRGTTNCGDDGWGDATIREEDIVGERYFDTSALEDHPEDDEDDGENDEWAPLDMKNNPLGMNITLDGIKLPPSASQGEEAQRKNISRIVVTNKLEPISHEENLQRKSERLQKTRGQITSSAAAACKRSNDYFKRQQESIREMLKTNDERIAETAYLKLQERLQNVDDLLESLQEEEWAEEEGEGEERGGVGADVEYDTEEELANGSTLLDQILAMILGGLPPKEGSGSETIAAGRREETEHYRYIREEHKLIVKEWLVTFGRLPPFHSDEDPEMDPEPLEGRIPKRFGDDLSSSPETKNCLSSNLSVGKQIDLNPIDNDERNWDEVEDWDAYS